ncbi:hypothetical protein [Lactiplantibacillus plantarum]|uniref:hypothetical protein n=1 Tax=Lactiplantibacillus plantarum TaxID=1590 RepID=UPI0025726A41|nr:hypothetical protein [Lactiplantibacillus plantarum]BEI53622.1 hypothetical protein AWA2045_17530 [Lactiplantibacillus plantarum]BEI54977.1 hypothetical protein AWA2045_31080 [Lactiplantibacillus plantarum]
MELSHTSDGYWVLYGSGTYEPDGNIQAIMRQARKDFIKANPLIDSSKVVVFNGEFEQAINKAEVSKNLASMIIDGAS